MHKIMHELYAKVVHFYTLNVILAVVPFLMVLNNLFDAFFSNKFINRSFFLSLITLRISHYYSFVTSKHTISALIVFKTQNYAP